jgi:predicted GNAT family N-acyltransferase
MTTIQEITVEKAYIVRHPVLRKGKPMDSCRFEGDDLSSTKHFGLYNEDKLVAVVTLMENNHNYFDDKNQMQLRGMAVNEDFQKHGFGKQLITYCENYIKTQSKKLIWFAARVSAQQFYEKQGYTIKGESFNIDKIGLHYIMYKYV